MLLPLAAACTRPPGPEGWTGASPVAQNGDGLVLAAHESTLYALPGDSTTPEWRFPPSDEDTYPVSDAGQAALNGELDNLELSQEASQPIETRIGGLTVGGSSPGALKDAIDATSADSDAKKQLSDLVDRIATAERKAIKDIEALYGDIGISEDGNTAYVPAFGGAVYALDTADGHARWLFDAGDELIGGTTVDGDTLYFGSKGNTLFALDATTGGRTWTFNTGGEVWATPTVADGTIYVTSLEGTLFAVDESGAEKWRFTGAGAAIAARPVVDGDAVYVGAFDNRLYSVRRSDGLENWAFSADNWFWGAAVVRQGIVYAASLDSNVYAVDAASGEPRWGSPFDAGAPVRSGPTIAGDGLVVATRAGEVYKLDLETGEAQAGSPVTAGSRVYADLTTDGEDLVYAVPTKPSLFVIDAARALTTSEIPLPE